MFKVTSTAQGCGLLLKLNNSIFDRISVQLYSYCPAFLFVNLSIVFNTTPLIGFQV